MPALRPREPAPTAGDLQGAAAGRIDVTVSAGRGRVEVALVDDGEAFNPVEAPVIELGETIEDRRIGGLGLKFVRTYMDRLDYRRDGELNRLHLVMDINSAKRRQGGG